MGCSSSVPANTPRGEAPAHRNNSLAPINATSTQNTTSTKGKAIPPIAPSSPVKKPVAFTVSAEIEDTKGEELNSELENIFHKPLPKRLQHLTPLENAPKISPEKLEEKLKKAERKRQNALEERKQPGRKVSRRHSELLVARELSSTTVTAEGADKLQDRMDSVEITRLAKLADIQAKQKIREERGRRARERAQRLKNSGVDELEYEIEHSLEQNKTYDDLDAEVDSWLESDSRIVSAETRMTTASSLVKPGAPPSSGYSSREISASSNNPSEIGLVNGFPNPAVLQPINGIPKSRKVTQPLDDSDDGSFFD